MGNPYRITEPTVISFSGGRSSAYMLHHVLNANGGLPDDSRVIFANTGREMPETLDFVRECATRWCVPITWVELGEIESAGVYEKGRHKGKAIRKYTTNVVDYETASRNGEPFRRLVMSRKMPPNVVARFCTADLKVRRMLDVSNDQSCHYIGIRADEQRRAVKIHNKEDGGRLTWCPMYLDGITAADVGQFWKRQAFDLRLPNNNGVTDFGNCDLCFLKGKRMRVSIARQRPDLLDWWVSLESDLAKQLGKPALFDKDLSYQGIADIIATDSQSMDFGDETFACFCGD